MPNTQKTAMSNKLYDVAKDVTTLWLPALGTFYAALALIWGFPAGEQVVGTVAALVTFLGVGLKVSTNRYNKSDDRYDGALAISHTAVKDTYSIELDTSLAQVEGQQQIVLRVVNDASQ